YNKSVSGFDFGYVQPIEPAVRARYAAINDPLLKAARPDIFVRGGLLFPGVGTDGDGLYETPKHNFMPRIGFAFQINSKTVLRGGYGIFYGFLGERRGDVIQTGFSQVTNFVPTTNNINFNTWSNPFPNGILSPVGSSKGPQTNLGNPIAFFNQHPQTPYNQRWELGVQRELPGGFVIEASYVGNRGTHIELTQDLNAVPNRFLSKLPTQDTVTRSFLTGSVPNPFAGLGIPGVGANSTIQRQNLLKPFPQFGNVITTNNDGYSWYHAGQLRIEKRFSRGYTIQAAYTHSKFMQATEYLNPGDPLPTRTISDQDYPNRFSVSSIVELPFGKGHRFLSNSNGVVSRLAGGWQVQGVYAYQTGAPLTFNNNTSNSPFFNTPTATAGYIYFGDLKNLKIPSDQQSLARWFNTLGFVALRTATGTVVTQNGQTVWVDFNDPCKNAYNATTCPGSPLTTLAGFNRDTAFQLANNVRTFPLRFSFLRVQPTNNVDFSIIKNTRINERMSVQFRGEMTNAFNHPWLSAASGASGSSGVITVPTNADFGKIANISNQGNYARRVQLGIKLIF